MVMVAAAATVAAAEILVEFLLLSHRRFGVRMIRALAWRQQANNSLTAERKVWIQWRPLFQYNTKKIVQTKWHSNVGCEQTDWQAHEISFSFVKRQKYHSKSIKPNIWRVTNKCAQLCCFQPRRNERTLTYKKTVDCFCHRKQNRNFTAISTLSADSKFQLSNLATCQQTNCTHNHIEIISICR